MKQFLFIKTVSEVYTIPASALKVVEYASDTSVALLFETHKDGKESTITVRLSITSGKAADVITAISSQIANSNATVFKYDDINDTFFTKNVTGVGTIVVTTPTDSIAVTCSPPLSNPITSADAFKGEAKVMLASLDACALIITIICPGIVPAATV